MSCLVCSRARERAMNQAPWRQGRSGQTRSGTAAGSVDSDLMPGAAERSRRQFRRIGTTGHRVRRRAHCRGGCRLTRPQPGRGWNVKLFATPGPAKLPLGEHSRRMRRALGELPGHQGRGTARTATPSAPPSGGVWQPAWALAATMILGRVCASLTRGRSGAEADAGSHKEKARKIKRSPGLLSLA